MASESDVRRFFAESGRQSELDRIGIAEATRQFEGGQLTRQAPGGFDINAALELQRRQFEQLQQFKAPAIETLQARTPAREEAFGELRGATEAQRPTIEQRYKDTLAEITQVTRGAAATEFTRRGIPLSSGLVEQTVGTRLAPQIAQAAGQRDISQLGITQLLANIGMGEEAAGTDLAQAISGIQAATGTGAISAAQNIFAQQQQSRQFDLTRQLQQQQFQAEEARALRFDPFQESLIQAQIANQQRLSGGGAGVTTPFTPTAQDIQTTFGNPPAYSPTGGEGSWDRQPDGTIWEFSGGRWVQR